VLSLGACSQVLRHICTDPWLWKQIYGRRFGTHTLLVPLNDDASDAEETQQHEIEELHEGFGTPVAEARGMWSGQAWPAHPPYTADPDNSEDEDDWLGRYKRAISMNALVQTGLVVNEGLFILDGVCHTCLSFYRSGGWPSMMSHVRTCVGSVIRSHQELGIERQRDARSGRPDEATAWLVVG
jgi:hypothetical protein